VRVAHALPVRRSSPTLDRMDPLVLLLAFASFIGGLLVASRVIDWIAGLALFFKGPADSYRSGFVIAALLLHSGPWVLALAVAALFYAGSSSRDAYRWAAIGGFALALCVLGAAMLRIVLRQRNTDSGPPPLTPERFIALRRRFFWLSSLFFAFCIPATLLFQIPLSFSRDFGFLLFVFVLSFLGGWAWSWFMWQFYGASLQANENRRKKEREKKNAV
jgi:hypothetical protein